MGKSGADDRRAIWDQVGAGYAARYESAETRLAEVNAWLLSRTKPRPGEVVLDLAGGTGALGHGIAERIGPKGRVISSDVSPEMVELSRQFASSRGLDNVDFRVLDAEHVDLAAGSVDCVVCRSAMMLLDDPAAALSEAHRVLKPGGTFAFTVFTNPADNPWVALPMRAFVERGHLAPPDQSGPGMFALGEPDSLRQRVLNVFAEVEVEKIDFTFDWADDEAVWRVIVDVNALLGPVVKAMAPEQQAGIRAEVLDRFASYRNEAGSYSVPAAVLGVAARSRSQ